LSRARRSAHPRITYLAGRSSTDPDLIKDVRQKINGRSVLVMLDSDHSEPHVRAELDAYAPFVQPGGYIHIPDATIDTLPEIGGMVGPLGAIKDFLAASPSFVRDETVESRYLLTMHPYGWLQRVS
jgi:cephalosporin hydroxylase